MPDRFGKTEESAVDDSQHARRQVRVDADHLGEIVDIRMLVVHQPPQLEVNLGQRNQFGHFLQALFDFRHDWILGLLFSGRFG
jgi:hypothetical protein